MAHNPAFDEKRCADDLAALHDALAEQHPVVRMVTASGEFSGRPDPVKFEIHVAPSDIDPEPSSLQEHLTRPGRRGADWHYPADRLPGVDR